MRRQERRSLPQINKTFNSPGTHISLTLPIFFQFKRRMLYVQIRTNEHTHAEVINHLRPRAELSINVNPSNKYTF